MIENLTDADRSKLKKLNLFRLDNDWFNVLYGSCLLIFIYSFFLPYYGWRHKPTHLPANKIEYISKVIDTFLFFSPVYLLAIANFFVKTLERRKDCKFITNGKVSFKSKLIFKMKLILFHPFKLLIYKRPLQFADVEKGTEVTMELTYFRRL